MAALYLHNSIWVPDAESPSPSPSPHQRTTSSATIQTLQISDLSHPTQPLLHSSTSESVAYLDLLSRQPTHPNAPRGSPIGLSFDGDPTTVRERKGYLEKVVRKRLRRLKAVMAALEVIMVCWSLYTTVRYFLAFAIYPSSTSGYAVSLVLATVSLVSVAVLFAAAVIPFLQTYLLGRNITITALLTVRMVLRYTASLLLLAPAAANFALVFAWRHSALDAGDRCAVDLDVVWPIHSHAGCAPPPWDAWLALAIVRLVLTGAILTIYHLALASYQHIRRPSLWRSSTFSESSGTYLGSPPMSMSVTPLPHEHIHQPSMSTLGSGSGNSHPSSPNSKPPPDPRSLRSSRSRGSMHPGSPSTGETNLRLPRLTDSPRSSNDSGAQDEFDPYADLPPLPTGQAPSPPPPLSESDRELNNFVDRFRSLVTQINRETEDGANVASSSSSFVPPSPSSSYTSFSANAVGYDEFGRPYPPDDHVRILNSYIRRMPTIESIGSRELGTSVAASSLYQEQRTADWTSQHTLSRPPTRAMTDRSERDEAPSRAGSLSLAAVELINAMGGVEGVPEHLGLSLGEVVGRVRRAGSIGSSGSQSGGTGGTAGTGGTGGTTGTNASGGGASYFTAASGSGSPMLESPLEGLPTPVSTPASGGEASGSQQQHGSPPLRSLPPPPRAFMHAPIAEEEPGTDHDVPLPSPSPSLPPLPRSLRPLPRPPGLARADSV